MKNDALKQDAFEEAYAANNDIDLSGWGSP